MKKVFLLCSFATLLITGTMSSCSKKSAEGTTSKAVVYTCPMDTDIVANTPGKCPKCGMDLVVKK